VFACLGSTSVATKPSRRLISDEPLSTLRAEAGTPRLDAQKHYGPLIGPHWIAQQIGFNVSGAGKAIRDSRTRNQAHTFFQRKINLPCIAQCSLKRLPE